jgi:hypothetical protein
MNLKPAFIIAALALVIAVIYFGTTGVKNFDANTQRIKQKGQAPR